MAIGTGRLNSNPNRVGAAVDDVAAVTEEEEDDMMKTVDAVTTIKVQSRYHIPSTGTSICDYT